ncbi:MAG TPA: 50S ribosomal protein L9 [Nitrospiraceae bacterium]|nr:MAG: 50S ribosomal protein L9 [Nitrospirae bacterium GWA2_46_11]OGW24092.1 MAG: 50S ribosomal protein L9 [Nitrospirae bacterium GWB2_47_37]HAK88714.1 50S ribosomal protein L9 [Nitrospiraceae bacterium]HCZ10907.1 50S ribosomal protein L9 [Nitrospiraceae bacterium]
MQVILKDNVKDVGHIGDMVNVKDGFARNFLIPKGFAVEANPKNLKALEHEKRKIQELVKKAKSAAEDMAAKISGTSITIKAKSGEEDKLFGSVTAMDIAEALKKEGLDVDKKKIVIDEPIKRLGSYTVSVKIHQEVSAQVNVQVVSE